MADWSCFVDEPDYHDPEVAVADGYRDIPLPPGALSLIAVATEVLDALPADRPLRRSWRSTRPVVVGERLYLTVAQKDGSVSGEFSTGAGEPVAWETLSVAEGPAPVDRGTPVFATGVIDATRRRALAWSVSQLRPEGSWRWGAEPAAVADLCWRLIAPGLVAARAAVTGADAAHRIREIEVSANGSLDAGSALVAESLFRAPGRTDLSIVVGDHLFARATVMDSEPDQQAARGA
jgi:hypothetical protein